MGRAKLNFTLFGIKARYQTVVVLGAGASHGYGNGNDELRLAPPVDANFFRTLQSLPSPSRSTTALLRFVREEYGAALDVSMERFYTEAEAADRFHQEFNVTRGPVLRRFKNALRWFHEALPEVFQETIGTNQCIFHSALAANLETTDAIISYNYDCLMDDALCESGGNKWRADKGYAVNIRQGAENWQQHGQGRVAKQGIKLLKPHGSLNWDIDDEFVTLLPQAYALGSAEGQIIPPTRNKEIDSTIFKSVWKASRAVVERAKALVVIGYSMPEQDLMSRVLFRTEARNNGGLKALIVADPDRDVRRRVIETLSPALSRDAQIVQFATMAGLTMNFPDYGSEYPGWETPV